MVLYMEDIPAVNKHLPRLVAYLKAGGQSNMRWRTWVSAALSIWENAVGRIDGPRAHVLKRSACGQVVCDSILSIEIKLMLG